MGGNIFISYRRGDGGGSAGRLYDRLEQEFGRERVFFDVDTIAPGQDFVQVLEDKVDTCDVLLAVIGRSWLEARDENGQRRLDSPDDFVRIEVAHALSGSKRVIPVLVDAAQIPSGESLPDDLKALTRRNAVRVSHESFKADCDRLTRALQAALGTSVSKTGVTGENRTNRAADGPARSESARRWPIALGSTRRRFVAGGAVTVALGAPALWYVSRSRVREAESTLVLKTQHTSTEAATVDVHPKGELVVSGGNKSVRLWNATTGALVAEGVGHAERIESVRFAPKEDVVRVVSASHDVEARIWNGTALEAFKTLPNQNPEAVTKETDSVDQSKILAEWSPDATRIVTAAHIKAYIWEAETGKLLSELKGHRGYVDAVAFAPDGSYFATICLNGVLIFWPRDASKSPVGFPAHADVTTVVGVSPDSRLVVTGSFDGTAKLWKPMVSTTATHVLGHEDNVNAARFAPHNGTVVTASSDKNVRLWNALSGELITVMRGHEESVLDARFSADGSTIVSAGWDKTARLWNALTGELIAVLVGHTSTIRGATFMPGGQRILTWSDDDTTRIWNKPAAVG
jgi:WD40 repeat protein